MAESLLSSPSDAKTSPEKQDEKELETKARAAAREIAEASQTFDYIFGVWQKRHNGDAQLGKALLFSLGCQSVSNSRGIHVAATGEGGYGKSDGIKKMGKLIYPDFWKNGGFTRRPYTIREEVCRMELLWDWRMSSGGRTSERQSRGSPQISRKGD